ncbi:hypothetical protein PV326_002103, partial [Microctonus aethiopoides]
KRQECIRLDKHIRLSSIWQSDGLPLIAQSPSVIPGITSRRMLKTINSTIHYTKFKNLFLELSPYEMQEDEEMRSGEEKKKGKTRLRVVVSDILALKKRRRD